MALDALLRDAGLLLLAWLLGGLIGWQREAHGRAAGLRTNALVCLGSCLITRVSLHIGDPGRIAAQIVTGIGFLGAGVILRRGGSVHGLTTAATVWVVAGVGIAVGAGEAFAALATLATILILITLATRLEDRIGKNKRVVTLSITLPRHQGAVAQMLAALTEAGADVIHFDVDEADEESGPRTITVGLRLRQDVTRAALARSLAESAPDAAFTWE